mmetsp:Transcript_3830/g.11074  ORF Transcript_3830/g.11074 Transcript_3830/m.11074 type:complete len:383 (+) Transcript_3830:1567-2715(+)
MQERRRTKHHRSYVPLLWYPLSLELGWLSSQNLVPPRQNQSSILPLLRTRLALKNLSPLVVNKNHATRKTSSPCIPTSSKPRAARGRPAPEMLEELVDAELQACVGDASQHREPQAAVERGDTLLPYHAHEAVKRIAVAIARELQPPSQSLVGVHAEVRSGGAERARAEAPERVPARVSTPALRALPLREVEGAKLDGLVGETAEQRRRDAAVEPAHALGSEHKRERARDARPRLRAEHASDARARQVQRVRGHHRRRAGCRASDARGVLQAQPSLQQGLVGVVAAQQDALVRHGSHHIGDIALPEGPRALLPQHLAHALDHASRLARLHEQLHAVQRRDARLRHRRRRAAEHGEAGGLIAVAAAKSRYYHMRARRELGGWR